MLKQLRPQMTKEIRMLIVIETSNHAVISKVFLSHLVCGLWPF